MTDTTIDTPIEDAPAPPPVEEAPPEDAPVATPAAEAHAEELGVDLSTVEGTGADGKILKSDVAAAAEDVDLATPGHRTTTRTIIHNGVEYATGSIIDTSDEATWSADVVAQLTADGAIE